MENKSFLMASNIPEMPSGVKKISKRNGEGFIIQVVRIMKRQSKNTVIL